MVAPGLKTRYVDIYLPSEDAKREWDEEAKKAGIPLSKFVFESVEAFRAARDETPKSEMVKELADVKEEAQKLRSELKLKTHRVYEGMRLRAFTGESACRLLVAY